MKDKKNSYEKSKAHKTEIIIIGITIVTITGAVLIAKNCGLFKPQNTANLLKNGAKTKNKIVPLIPETIQKTVVDIPFNEKIINVSKFIRNLHEGWKASPEKLESALKYGFELEPNQTWVDDYSKRCA